jgi:hypothetical protein
VNAPTLWQLPPLVICVTACENGNITNQKVNNGKRKNTPQVRKNVLDQVNVMRFSK